MGVVGAYGSFVVRRPGRSYCLTCGGMLGMLLACVVLFQAMGTDFINYQMEVPLYLRGNRARDLDDAVMAGRDSAANFSPVPALQLERASNQETPLSSGMVLKLLFIAEDGIYQAGTLARVLEVQQRILDSAAIKSACQLAWSDDADPSANHTELELPPCVPPRTQLQACEDAATDCVGLLDASGAVEQDVVDTRVAALWGLDPFSSAEAFSFFLTAASVFGQEGKTHRDVKAMSVVFMFGLPLSGYANINDRNEEQVAALEDFIIGDLMQELVDTQDALNGGDFGLTMWYNGFGFRRGIMQRQIPSDVSWAVFSFIFVFVFLSLMKSSMWISSMGMGMIFMAFGPALLIYRFIIGLSYFGIFNLLCIFIVLGIGADDIFVFTDTWEHSAHMEELHTKTQRMQWTLQRAGGAMLVTSVTTMVSFLATAQSSFPGISTFGSFASTLVFANFCAVVIFFPTVVSVADAYFPGRCCCCPCLGGGGSKASGASVAPATSAADGKGASGPARQTPPKRGRLQLYFEDTHPRFVNAHRRKIIVAFLALMAAVGYIASQLEVDPEPPQMFPAGNNFAEYSPAEKVHFGQGLGTNQHRIKVEVVHGFALADGANPIDRTGTDPAIKEDVGVPNFAEELSFHQLAPCVQAICARFKASANDTLGLLGGDESIVTCWTTELFEGFYEPMYGLNASAQWALDIAPGAEAELAFDTKLQAYLSSPAASPDMRRDVVYGLVGDARVPRLSVVRVETSKERNMAYSDGIDYVETWNATVLSWVTDEIAECAALQVATPGAMAMPRTGERFYVSKTLIREAFTGILFSLGFALVILTIFSGNVIVAATAIIIIASVVCVVVANIVLSGAKLGMLQSLLLVMVPGLAVDSTAHLCEAYIAESHGSTGAEDRYARMTGALAHVGISVLSGAVTTMGASFVLQVGPTIRFFTLFGTSIFLVVTVGALFSLFCFSALMYEFGPQKEFGNIPNPFRSSKST